MLIVLIFLYYNLFILCIGIILREVLHAILLSSHSSNV